MGELTAPRTQPSRPITGACYTGPVSLKVGTPRSKTMVKGYISIFVCLATKAIHLEVVTWLTSDAFLAALCRFIARRGRPNTIYSDSGPNFQGGPNHLRELHKLLSSTTHAEKIQNYLSNEDSNWKFKQQHTPHFGRLWEAVVKSLK
jgi:hypothetical protein